MNTKHFRTASLALSLLLLPFASAQGATFLAPLNETASLRSEASGDVYAASNSVVITAPVAGDIFAAGENIDISGSSQDSIFAAGRTLAITGDVQDDVRVAGSIISIGSKIAHDLFAAGSSILITQDSHVHGDAYLAGETITIAGTIHGNVQAAGNKVVVAKGAVVMGSLTVRGNAPIIEEGSTVSGKITTIAPKQSERSSRGGRSFLLFIQSAVSSAVLALLFVFCAPVLAAHGKELVTKSPVRAGLVGFIWLLACLPATLLLMISGIGIYAGIFILSVTLPILVLALALMIISTGSIVYRLVAKQDGTVWHHAIIGAVLVSLVGLLGPLGFIVLSIAFLVALGSVLQTLWSLIQGK